MDTQYKCDLRASTQPLYLDKDDNLSDHVTYQHFKDLKQDLRQDRLEYDYGNDFDLELPKRVHRFQSVVLKNIDWNQLRIFYFVVKAGSFTKAEKYLHLSQPSISRAIRNLEASLGEQLLLRASSPANATITLTPTGWMVLEQVTQGAQCFDVLNAHAQQNHKKRRKNLNLDKFIF
ncbi:MAG: LysR family transcriptional regulator [Janthinobacterium lividum]